MQKVVLFLLGQKGYKVLEAALYSNFTSKISHVVIGRDLNLRDDLSSEIISLCKINNIPYFERNNVPNGLFCFGHYMAISAGWRWLINDPFSQIIVLHDSILPKYRGFNPLVTALLNKDSVIGVTAIIAKEDFDCGDIVEIKKVSIEYPIKVVDALNIISQLYFDISNSIFSILKENKLLKGVPQDNSKASYSVWRDDEDYRIDWSWSAEKITHFINSISHPYKGASAICNGALIRILDAQPSVDVEIANRDIGKVLFVFDGKPLVICGTGLLRIDEAIDSDGRNILPLKKFRTRLK